MYNTETPLLFQQTVLLLLVSMSLAVIPAAAGESAQQHIDDPSTVLDMEPSESKVKIYKGFGYGYGGKDEFFNKKKD